MEQIYEKVNELNDLIKRASDDDYVVTIDTIDATYCGHRPYPIVSCSVWKYVKPNYDG